MFSRLINSHDGYTAKYGRDRLKTLPIVDDARSAELIALFT